MSQDTLNELNEAIELTEKAAKRIIQGIKRNQFEISLPRRMTIIMKFLSLLPYPVFFAITRRLLR